MDQTYDAMGAKASSKQSSPWPEAHIKQRSYNINMYSIEWWKKGINRRLILKLWDGRRGVGLNKMSLFECQQRKIYFDSVAVIMSRYYTVYLARK